MKHPKSYSLPASPFSFSSSRPSPTWPSLPEPARRTEFIELLARTNFSFLQGASHPEEMVLRAKQLGYRGIALCDVNGLYGVVRGFQAAERPSSFDASQIAHTHSDGAPRSPFHYICGAELTPYDASPIVLLPMNKEGYVRLCHLITTAKRRAPKNHVVVSLRDIAATREDLIAFPLPPWREEDLKILLEAFQDRLYLPVHKDFSWESIRLYQQALKIEHSLGISPFATQRPLFHMAERKPLHDVLTCILHKTTLKKAATRLTLNRERYLKPSQELATLFRERPDMLDRTLEIAARIDFSLTELRYRYPQEGLPLGRTAPEYLRELVNKGLHWRYPPDTPFELMSKVHQQVERELKLIQEMEYEDYFLTLSDICQFARSQGILHQGRGSAANSIVCFALGLTSVDPVRLGLLFERFISKERGEPPDIDIDFEHERREEVIQYIYDKYGHERAAMVCTVIRYRSRMAIREVAKVMGLTLEQTDALVKYMGREGLSRLLNDSKCVSRFGLTEEKFKTLLNLALEMQGFPRHLGIHTGGFVISQDSMVHIVPVESATKDRRYVIQWNKDDINILGLMKIDVLSLGMLTAIRKSLDSLREHKGIDWNLSQVPREDPDTYTMIQKADTVGVFQIESRAQMSLLPRLKPKCYYDLVIEVAIVRPGPIQGGMVHPYLRRRSGKEKVTYAHPALVPILKKTLGVPLFQEQIMQIAVAVAGFTPGESDELRRVVSSAWKKKAIMEGLRQRVISGMLGHGLSREYAEQIYKTIEGFSSYGFPESHAASFALLTYVSCYLKRHHPDVFTCALLNSQPMGFYSPRQLIADAQRHDVSFLPLDVQNSQWDYTLHKPSLLEKSFSESRNSASTLSIRVGFRSIYGLRQEHADTIVRARQDGGGFRDLTDFIRRTKLPRHVMIRLGSAGALECFGLTAREAIWTIQGLSFDPESLSFGSSPSLNEERQRQENSLLPPEDSWQSIRREYDTKGFSIENHPLSVLRPLLLRSSYRYTTARQLATLRHRSRVRAAGLVSLLQKPPTAKGMCFVSLEDETGLFNIVIAPDVYQRCRLTLLSSPLLEVEGFLESYEGVRNIKARAIRPLALPPRLLSSRPRADVEKPLDVVDEGI